MIGDLKISVIQSDLYWENRDANLAMFEEKIWQINSQPDIIVLPETFTTGFSAKPRELSEPAHTTTFRWMQQQAAQTRAVIIGSYFVQEQGKFYNRLYAVFPDGGSFYYDKRHLFTPGGERDGFTPGNSRLIFNIKGWKVMPLICYDLRFPVWSKSAIQGDSQYEYDCLIYVANWPSARTDSWSHLLVARAIENSAYCVGANRVGTDGNGTEYSGNSAVYSYTGKMLNGSTKEEILNTSLSLDELHSYRKRFPFQADSDQFSIRY